MNDRYPRVDVFEWRPAGRAINFGDRLATVVPERILALRGRAIDEETQQRRRLFTVGSVMHFAGDGDVVWGTGVNGKIPADRHVFNGLDVRAVRGPLTAEFLMKRGIEVPEVYGDPALLLPLLFPNRFSRGSVRPILFVPNLHDIAEAPGLGVPWISPLRGWNAIVNQILKSDLVLASSLHGVILAEAFGIPARHVRLSDTEPPFKYDDYAQGTGRITIGSARNVPEAIEMGGAPPVLFDPQTLLSAFPDDLWNTAFEASADLGSTLYKDLDHGG
jgi:pyruvyltransferase